MPTYLTYLVLSAVLTVALILPSFVGRALTAGGASWMMGSRGDSLKVAPWIERGDRAHRNMLENIAPFAIVVLVAHVSGKGNDTVSLGASIFFFARVAHAIIYLAGVPYLRTLAYLAGVFGTVLALVPIFSK